jgi:dihydrofolate synthase/folylpolyglutamate synthase
MGGEWDATNVADGVVAVVTPIGVDHVKYLGSSPDEIAVEKAGIIKPGAVAVMAEQLPGPAEILLRRCAEVGATPIREGLEFGVVSRVPAVGGQLLTLRAQQAEYDDVFLPLYGAHQAQNAATALAAVEAFCGDRPLDAELVRDAFARASSPGRLEIIRRSPMILLDAAHNPHGAAAVVAAIDDSFAFSPLIGVIGAMIDKDVEGVLAAFEPVLAHVVCTQNSTDRAMPAGELARLAREVFGDDRVSVAPRLADAIDEATALAEAGEALGTSIGSGAVIVTGSVVTVGEARSLLRRRGTS